MTATWSTPSDFAATHVVTKDEWNTIQGASGDVVFLYNAMQSIDSASSAHVLETTYQNTTGRIRAVNVVANGLTTTSIFAYIGTTSPPTHLVAGFANTDSTQQPATVNFVVPPTYYYTVSSDNLHTLQMWYEWNLHAT